MSSSLVGRTQSPTDIGAVSYVRRFAKGRRSATSTARTASRISMPIPSLRPFLEQGFQAAGTYRSILVHRGSVAGVGNIASSWDDTSTCSGGPCRCVPLPTLLRRSDRGCKHPETSRRGSSERRLWSCWSQESRSFGPLTECSSAERYAEGHHQWTTVSMSGGSWEARPPPNSQQPNARSSRIKAFLCRAKVPSRAPEHGDTQH